MRANAAARAQPRDDQPSVCALHQGRGHGHILHPEVRSLQHRFIPHGTYGIIGVVEYIR